MTLDLSEFHDAFFEESFEALDSMESTLLALNLGAIDHEQINTIFRVAHSIKGGSATFGFSEVAAFTHTLETILDQLRSGQRQVQPATVDVLLRSVDVMRDMLLATQRKQPLDEARVAGLHRELETLLASEQSGTEGKPPAREALTPVATPTEAPDHAGWRIRLAPGPALLRNGNDPLRMLRELNVLGTAITRVDTSMLPPRMADLDAEVCVLSWETELATQADESTVRAVFEWAEGECVLEVEPLSPAGELVTASNLPEAHGRSSVVTTADPRSVVTKAEESSPEAASYEGPDRRSNDGGGTDRRSNDGGGTDRRASDGGSIRVSTDKIDELLNSVGELVITQSVLSQLASALAGRQAEDLRMELAQFERHMRSLQESVMRIRMLPISSVFNRIPRMVRDLGQRLGKNVELKMSGEQTELDKTVMERIGDPLVHLVRNSIDHGIEMPETRLAAGKPAQGTVHLLAYHKGGNVIVEVTDDGAGLNKDRILQKARERGLVREDEELSEERIFNLIFQPGFSTVETVSDVSGRGVGMDVVRRNINELGGHVQIQSVAGQGSTFRIRLPLTLAIMDGQLARVGREMYIVPIVSIIETIQVKRENVSSIADQAQLLRLRGEYLPIMRLYDLFQITPDHTDLLDGLLMIVEADGRRAGLFVDELMSQQQVVIKSLETNFHQVAGLSGATMLGDGRVALILDIPSLIVIHHNQEGRRLAASEAA